jgi:hypothetical protein
MDRQHDKSNKVKCDLQKMLSLQFPDFESGLLAVYSLGGFRIRI